MLHQNPRPPKKRKTVKNNAAPAQEEESKDVSSVIVQFQTPEGETTGPQLEMPISATTNQLQELINQLLSNDEPNPYTFFLNEQEIASSLEETIREQKTSTEVALTIVYQPEAVFRVRPVTRCASDLSGHSEAVLAVSFSPNGKLLASGSGDTTVRIWDVLTQTPKFVCNGHKNWVFSVVWSPNGAYLASGGMDREIRIWDPETGEQVGSPLSGHTDYITSLSWEPAHKNADCVRIASGSKDGTVRIWNVRTGRCELSLSGHSKHVTCVKWGGMGLLYSASRDRTIKVWDPSRGILVRTLEGHAHWVTTLALNTDSALRSGAFDHRGIGPSDEKEILSTAQARYDKVKGNGAELMVSGSDDFTLHLWDPVNSKKPIIRMTGHQQPISFVTYSPDGRNIASCAFDKSVKLWNGTTGKYINSLRAHVEAVYQVGWSGDSRMLVSASKDSTMKIWELRTQKRLFDLPGHADEVYCVDWSPDGDKVASGSKDRTIKIWCR